MALKLKIQTQSGIHVGYHRIVSTNIHWAAKRVSFSISSYLSEYMRRCGKDPVETMDINIEMDFLANQTGESLLSILYAWVKANAVGFENAKDC